MIRTLNKDLNSSWKDYVNKSLHAYNCAKNSTRDYSPFFLLFGRKPILPIDLLLNTVNQKQSRNTFVKKLRH